MTDAIKPIGEVVEKLVVSIGVDHIKQRLEVGDYRGAGVLCRQLERIQQRVEERDTA